MLRWAAVLPELLLKWEAVGERYTTPPVVDAMAVVCCEDLSDANQKEDKPASNNLVCE
ncbi:hypothetical protein GCM10011323_18670 [Pontibacter amylolyticus]|uniref:Uncharacterized protein n=1 Tax=Pontibacter amylolyticus TaxID=1424080 RepID=A0ABQ1W5G4_9BACT|nr:hypothetical protein GCM10011323_18670 [Pontibacter amylolyticus]